MDVPGMRWAHTLTIAEYCYRHGAGAQQQKSIGPWSGVASPPTVTRLFLSRPVQSSTTADASRGRTEDDLEQKPKRLIGDGLPVLMRLWHF